MAVALYKDGEQHFVQPEFLQSHLDAGYKLTKEESLKKPVEQKTKRASRKAKSDD